MHFTLEKKASVCGTEVKLSLPCCVGDRSETKAVFSIVHAALNISEWLQILPFLGVLALLGYLAIRPFLMKKKQQKDSLINLKIQKENPKVVNEINIEDLHITKAAYCRCWRSKTFPVCDGSHNKHNELTGDNIGPLILKKKEV
ncbi:CDGSH iron-sulfur domain-containing protein 2 isoform X1 [Pseudophryne corroboree]|uniref:CDGSH iron-sulfur domain-containing protein 2 isoform X1 n=1 Tax=Pseudophryne corroboree TaxID=495146 RepID=UPI003081F708